MSSPRTHLAKMAMAIIDTHINIRKKEWKLIDESGSVHLPTVGSTAHEKLHMWLKYQNEFNNAAEKKTEQWIEIINALYNYQTEQQKGDHPWLRKVGYYANLSTWELLSPMTAEALRNLIINGIKDEPYYKYAHSDLIKQISTLEIAIPIEERNGNKQAVAKKREEVEALGKKLYALTDNRQSFKDFFNLIITQQDHRDLNEKTYEDYVVNVLEGKRGTEITDAVLKAVEIEKQNKVNIKQIEQPVDKIVSQPVETQSSEPEVEVNQAQVRQVAPAPEVPRPSPVTAPIFIPDHREEQTASKKKEASTLSDWPSLTENPTQTFFIPVNRKPAAASTINTRSKARKKSDDEYTPEAPSSDTSGVRNRRANRRY